MLENQELELLYGVRPAMLRYIALLGNFTSDTDELVFGYDNRTLQIRRLTEEELADFLRVSHIETAPDIYKLAISLGNDRFWLDYYFEVEEATDIQAFNMMNKDMERVVLALRLYKEGAVGIDFYAKKGISGILSSSSLTPRSGRTYCLNKSEVPKFGDFYHKFVNEAWLLRESRKPLGIALSRFDDEYERKKLEDKIIDCLVGLEALYMQGETLGEFSFKLALRTSALLSDNKEQRKEMFEKMKRCYKLRSDIVHGKKYIVENEDVWFVEDILRESIKKFLVTPIPNWLDLIFL